MLDAVQKLEVVTIDGFTDVPKNNERALLYAVSKQPVSVAIEASGLDFQLYDRVCKNVDESLIPETLLT